MGTNLKISESILPWPKVNHVFSVTWVWIFLRFYVCSLPTYAWFTLFVRWVVNGAETLLSAGSIDCSSCSSLADMLLVLHDRCQQGVLRSKNRTPRYTKSFTWGTSFNPWLEIQLKNIWFILIHTPESWQNTHSKQWYKDTRDTNSI